VAVDFSNFVRRYDLARIRKRARFLVKDAGFNAIYAADLECMEKLARIAGDDAHAYGKLRHRVIESMLERMYDPHDAAFYDVCDPGSRKLTVRTPTILFPLAVAELDERIAEQMVAKHLDSKEFLVPLPIPSVEPSDAAFFGGETPFLWRGPTWAFNNWFLYHGLRRRGFEQSADRLRSSLQKLVEQSGFREYYDPVVGTGYGAPNFTWSGLLLDMS
jgi:glycogen debranching enzyme